MRTLLSCSCSRACGLFLAASVAWAQGEDVLPGEPFERLGEVLQGNLAAALNPEASGWHSEARSDAVAAQLKKIAKVLEQPASAGGEALAGVFAEDFSFTHPASSQEVFADAAFRVLRVTEARGEATAAKAANPTTDRVGFMQRLMGMIAGASEVHAKFKFVRVYEEGVPGKPGLVTEAVLLVDGLRDGGAAQHNAWWQCHWFEDPAGKVPPRLWSVEVLDQHEVQARAASPRLFADCSEAVLGALPAWSEQLLPGLSSWRARFDTRLGLPLLGHAAGIAVGDVNGDGLEDLYLCQPGGLPNKLLLHQPDGRVVDASAEAGVDFLDFSRAALLVDLDDDGDRDLVVSAAERLLLLANDGRARFWLAGALDSPDTTSLAAADIDLDGDLDLYACAYASPYDHAALPVPYHDASNGMPNKLFENRGDWVFVEATAQRGLDQNNRRFSFAASFEDYDMDGDPDLYVANDFGRDNLYRNDGGTFRDVGAEAGADDISAGMGVTWGDYDGDGDFDLYVSNMYSSAGNRIAFQARFQAEASAEVRAHYQRHSRGNTLYRNEGDGTFEDVTPASPLNVAMGRWAWGALFADLNNDGWQDLLSPNGFLTEELSDDL
ncbi:MAG: VCBS repeat-containing protein [Planctomycetes bacterium]|nr:VCBS repeat-containing protein [Planctomycetota bacterium]